MKLDDPEVVRREYETEAGLTARASVEAGHRTFQAAGVAVGAVRKASPQRMLEHKHHGGHVPSFEEPLVAARVNPISVAET